ncbi:alkaline phosphatase, partial [bacterium]|nr:alkaline phosphatase [bacterium]
MKKYFRLAVIALITITLISAGRERQKPRNLIIFIGDGMGVAHVYAAMTVSGNEMTFPAFPVTGFSITHSKNSYSTDSAAGGTAIATGEKTDNRMISVRPDSTVLVTLLEHARASGKSTGIVCTSSLTDATPATFTAHVPLRYDYRAIASWYVSGTAEVFIGGGRKYFEPAVDSSGSFKRSEDVVSMLTWAGYDVTYVLSFIHISEPTRSLSLSFAVFW